MKVPARDVFLEHIVLHRPHDRSRIDTLTLRGDNVHRDEHWRGCVDGHRRAHVGERDAVEEILHVAHGVDRDAHLTDLAGAARIVAVETHLRGEVECHREPGLALREQVAKAFVRIGGGSEARVLTDAPEASAVHRRLNAARERGIAGEALVAERVVARKVGRCVERCDRDAAAGLEMLLALASLARRAQTLLLPFEQCLREVRFSFPHRRRH